MSTIQIKPRRRARFHAIQALYQHQVSQTPYTELKHQYHQDNEHRHQVEWEFFDHLLDGVSAHTSQLDAWIDPLVERDAEAVNPVERAILRLGVYELYYRLDIPYQVIVNEYVAQTEMMGAEEGHKFVNGILDKVARQVR